MSSAVKEHFNFIQNTNGIVAAIGFETLGKSVVGNLVTPAIWVLNYGASGSTPNGVDLGIYAASLINAPAGVITSTLKAVVDDNINMKVDMIRQQHDAKYRPFIHPVQSYGYLPPQIIALEIAGKGGVVWRGKNGQWVFITDARGVLVYNFEPNNYMQLIQPKKPLKRNANGEYDYCARSCSR